MKLRNDLFEGRLTGLEQQGKTWMDTQTSLGDKYAPQYAFAKTYWAMKSVGTYFFDIFFQPTYKDAARIARDFGVLTPPIRNWRYAVDRNKNGDALGWARSEFAVTAWKETDSCLDTWADLGIADYYGTVWYRTTVKLVDLPAGKKTFLWLSALDEQARVFVNGKLVGETPSGFAKPYSLDISGAVHANSDNQITIAATRSTLNELGTGGLLGPAVVYRER